MIKIGKYLFNWIEVPQIKSQGIVTARQIKSLFPKECDFKYGDELYDLFEDKEVMKIIKLNRFEEQKYVNRTRDCDDFSYVLMGHMHKLLPGMAFGIAWGEIHDSKGKYLYSHAINCFINQNKELVYIEPQTNEVIFKSDFPNKFVPILIVL